MSKGDKIKDFSQIIGRHPQDPHPLGRLTTAQDGVTESGVPHRALVEVDG